jgi:hypothetical protein
MKNKLIIVAICIGLLPLALKAQTTTTNGPELDLNETASAYVLDDNDDFMLFFSQKKGWSYDDVVITKYNKRTLEITEQAVDDDYEGRFVFLTDDNAIVNVVRFVTNKKNMMLEYQKASFPLDVKVPKKLDFTTFFSIPLKNKKESYYTRACFNADKSKFAIVSVTNSGMNQSKSQSVVDVAVFDNTANLLYHESKELELLYNPMGEDITVSLEGTVYITLIDNLYYYSTGDNGLQIITCSEQGISDYKETLDMKFTYKQMAKPNGDLCLVGIWNKFGQSDCKLKTYTVTPDGNVDFAEEDVSLSADYDGKSYDDGPFAKQEGSFIPHVFDMIQLKNGDFLLVGEMRRRVQVGSTGENGQFPIYGYLSHNIFYGMVSPEGTLRDMYVYPRITVTSEEAGRWKDSNPVYAFEYDGDPYLLYNDNRANYKDGRVHMLLYNRPDQCSVILSKIEGNGELSSTILYDAKTKMKDTRMVAQQHNHEYFLEILHQADDGIYYVLKHDGEFRLEKITF